MTPALRNLQLWVRTYERPGEPGPPRCHLGTLGNNGWAIQMQVSETNLKDMQFDWINYGTSPEGWILGRREEAGLEVNCDASKFVESLDLLSVILSTGEAPTPPWTQPPSETNGAATRLQRWYEQTCDGNWEHDYGIDIESLPDPGWNLTIDLLATAWEDLVIDPLTRRTSEHDWLHIRTTERGLHTTCGPMNLPDAIDQTLALLAPDTMTYPGNAGS
jgi:hypothetical protein